jgi:hypothetical protein
MRMTILKIKDSRRVNIRALLNKTRVRLRFGTDPDNQYESIEFELDAILVLALSEEIRKLLLPGNTAVPRRRTLSEGHLKLSPVRK